MARRSSTPAPAPGGPRSRSRSRTPVPVRTRRTFGDVLKAFCAFVALAVLVAGVPLALAYFIGWPLPHRMPSLDMLRDEVSVGVFINVLTVVVWLAWAQFTACVLVEAKAALSGVGLPARVPGAGPSQLLARQLITAILLLGSSTASFAPGLTHLGHTVQPHHPSQTVASAQLLPGQQRPAGAEGQPDAGGMHVMGGGGSDTVVLAGGGSGGERAGTARQASAHGDTSRAGQTKFYRIQPPVGRHHDSLWEIAERHLDDGRRYKEIYRLNKDRVQPDGSRLSEASLIRPGWIMEMPADAHGGELVEMPDDAQELSPKERAQYERYQEHGSGRDAGGRDAGDRGDDGRGDDGRGDDGRGDDGPGDDGGQRQERPSHKERDRSAQDEPTTPDSDASEDGADDNPALEPSVPEGNDSSDSSQDGDKGADSQAPTQPDQEIPETPDATGPGGKDTQEGRHDQGQREQDRDGGGSSDVEVRPDSEEKLEVPPGAHSPDRQEQSVPETPAEQQPTRTDDLGDSEDDDGLPGPGISQPSDIRPGAQDTRPGDASDGDVDDRTPGDRGTHSDSDRGAHSDDGSDGDSDSDGDGKGERGGKGDGKGAGTSTDLDNAELPDGDGTSQLDRSSEAADDNGALGPVGLPEALLGAPLLAAGVLAALGRRRRSALWRAVTGSGRRSPGDDFSPPSDPAAQARDALLAGADPAAVRFLDRALRGLAEDLADEGRELPVVYAAWLTGQDLHLQLAEESEQPPSPWRYGQNTSFWTILRAHTRFDVDTSGPSPYPALVSLGLRGQARLLLNLESVPGLVSVAGDEERRTAVLASVAAELATGSWSQGMEVTLVGFGQELTALAPERVRYLPGVAELLREREGADAPSRHRNAAPQVVLVGVEPGAAEARRLAALATESGGPRVGFVVGVSGGRLPSVVWEFTVDAEGTLAAPRMGLEVRAQLLPEQLRAAVVELFADTDDERTEGGQGPGFRVDLSEGGRPAVYARIMGSYDVTGIEPPEESRAALLHEALALLLLNRDGVHPRVLSSALWPKGVTDDVRDALVERLRGWLGIETDGTPRLSTDKDGRLVLRPSVVSDWDVLRTLHHGCTGERGAKLAPQVRRQKLAEALELARGPLLADRPEGRYGWLAYDVVEAQHPLLVAEIGLALCAEHLRFGEPEAAVHAVRAALRSASADERLWDALLRAAHATGERGDLDEAVRWVADRAAELHGPERGLPPRTRALLEELAPGAYLR
ncbi:BTAD domain-containing putative transcriptional regulator [Streptomyces sp. NPDC053499]|uniref:BTAD domain-containing putative transcriptional regulator n=1 Tax=Streptomyces sp. NPDC053499 TaxID=3365707 RepID=UPI0037D92396